MKERVPGEGFESEDDINTTLTASFHRLSEDEYGTTIDLLQHRYLLRPRIVHGVAFRKTEIFTDRGVRSSNHKHGSNGERGLLILQWIFFPNKYKTGFKAIHFHEC